MAKSAQNKIGDYQLVNTFSGYVARKDKTMLNPTYLIAPSKNVVIGTAGRPASVKGYTLDGAASTTNDSGIRSNFDFYNFKGDTRNMRAGFLTNLHTDGKLQFRYDNGTVTWLNLFGGDIVRSPLVYMSSIDLSFTTFFDTTEKLKVCLWVDGSGNVYEWNGALTTFASATGTTITKQGIMAAKTTIAFVASSKTITDTANGFITAGFVSGDKITVTGTLYNNKTFTILSVTAGVLTLAVESVVIDEAAGSAFTLTKYGESAWSSQGFYNTRDKKIIINNIEYTYTGGDTTGTLTGVTPDPTGAGIAVGTPIYQSPVITAISTMTGIETTFQPTLIGCGKDNQVYLGMSTSNNQYISKVNDYKNYSFTATRLAGEGMLLRLKAPPRKYVAQESQESKEAYDMYISSGENNWQVVRSTLSSDNAKEKLELIDLKIAPLQGAKSEKLVTKMKNHIVFLGCDKITNFLGYMSYQYVPVMTDFSYPIIDDMLSYDFTDASIFYHINYIYLAIPKHGIIRVYNMVDQSQQQSQYEVEGVDNQPWFWETPINYPISGFYVVNGELYGHSYYTSESYKLFTGGTFNGQDIECNATFAYDDKGERTQSKASDEIWVEGYIKQNTKLYITVAGDLDYFKTSQTKILDGSDSRLVSFGGNSGAIGKDPLGTKPLGGAITSTSSVALLPAWFHGVKTYPQVPFYLEQVSFTSKGVDQQWELICFGTNSKMTTEGNNYITE